MEAYLNEIWTVVASNVPRLVVALIVLVAGWILALLGGALARRILKRTSVDDRVAAWATGAEEGGPPRVERLGGRIVFWLLMVFVFVAFFSLLGLNAVAAPLSGFLDEVVGFLPRLLSAAVLLGIAWLVASGLRFALTRILGATRLDEKLAAELKEETMPPSKALAETVYWLVFLLFLPAVLGALGVEGLLAPVNELFGEVMAFLPNLFAALLILAVGWLIARVIRRVVVSVLAAAGADPLGERMGLGKVLGEGRLSILVGLVVYVLVLVPVVVAALDALRLESLTAPASAMLDQILAAVPQVFAAAVILSAAYLIGRLVARLVSELLAAAGFDGFLERIGFRRAEAAEDSKTPSEVAGWLALVAVMLFATIQALEMLGFAALTAIVTRFTLFAGDVLLAVVILAIGLYLANLAARAIESSGARNAAMLSLGARSAIVVLAGAMALRQAGVAEDIIDLAFGLSLGAAAVAAAIAFGLGGREIASRQLEKWLRGTGEE